MLKLTKNLAVEKTSLQLINNFQCLLELLDPGTERVKEGVSVHDITLCSSLLTPYYPNRSQFPSLMLIFKLDLSTVYQ